MTKTKQELSKKMKISTEELLTEINSLRRSRLNSQRKELEIAI